MAYNDLVKIAGTTWIEDLTSLDKRQADNRARILRSGGYSTRVLTSFPSYKAYKSGEPHKFIVYKRMK